MAIQTIPRKDGNNSYRVCVYSPKKGKCITRQFKILEDAEKFEKLLVSRIGKEPKQIGKKRKTESAKIKGWGF